MMDAQPAARGTIGERLRRLAEELTAIAQAVEAMERREQQRQSTLQAVLDDVNALTNHLQVLFDR